MRTDWDARAKENARYYVATLKDDWTDEEFFASGEQTVSEEILTDMINICQGKEPKQMRVIEIGCGAGRITRALARLFGEVHGVDVSGEMVAQARKALADTPNAFVYQNNGMDLSVVPPRSIRFRFFDDRLPAHPQPRSDLQLCSRSEPPASSRSAVQIPGAGRLRPCRPLRTIPGSACHFPTQDAVEMAEKCGFEPRYRHGAGEQYFWLWYFKQARELPLSLRARREAQ